MSRSRLIAVVGAKTHPCLTQVPTVDGVEFLKGGVAEFEAMTSNKLNEVEAMICCSLDSTLTDGLIKIFPTMPNIRWVHSFPAGVDTIAPFIKEHLIPRDIPLTNGRSAFSSSLAEWVLTACFYFNKQIPRCMSNRAAKRWDRFNMDVVDTKTIGFVGFGDISQLSAKYCKAVGMRVLAMRRDFFDEAAFKCMRSDAVFMSIGRGVVVDEDALARVMKTGHLKGAALDVFKMEPLPESSPLWDLENLLLTAHNADKTADFGELAWKVWRKNYDAFIGGKPWATPVDKQAGHFREDPKFNNHITHADWTQEWTATKDKPRSAELGSGKSGAAFIKSINGHYMIKTIDKREVQVQCESLNDYLNHFELSPNSLLMRHLMLLGVEEVAESGK
eukprot:gene8712-13484_t